MISMGIQLFAYHHPIAWLNDNQGTAIVLLTLALVLITAYYSFMSRQMTQLTKRSVEEAQNQYLNSQMPTVWFRLPNDQKTPLHKLDFTLQPWNVGPGSAMDLEVKILSPVEMRNVYEVETPYQLFGIALAPWSGVNIRFHVRSPPTEPPTPSFTKLIIIAEYRDKYGRVRLSTVNLVPGDEPTICLGSTQFSDPVFPTGQRG